MYRVVYKDLPCTIPGFLTMDQDGYYTIVLNSRMSLEKNQETYEHELDHIQNDDMYGDMSATEIEELRHT